MTAMIVQDFDIPRYGWQVRVYYAVDAYDTAAILHDLRSIGCKGSALETARRNLRAGRLDTGLTYSNFTGRSTVMVIALTSTPEEFQNSYDHEKGHLCRHISQACGIDPFSEEEQYLAGSIGQKMFPVARRFLCEHCRKKLMPG